jgi:hypothetical protein
MHLLYFFLKDIHLLVGDVKRKREDSEGMTLINFLLFIRQFGLYGRLNSNVCIYDSRPLYYMAKVCIVKK